MLGKTATELILEGLKLEKLISDFKFNEDILNAVIRREAVDKGVTTRAIPDSGFGMYAIQAYEGYSLIINAYMAINSDSLSDQDVKKLTDALKIFETLRQQNLDIYALGVAGYANYKTEQKTKVLEQLKNAGEVYMLGAFLKGGTAAHHAILKYAKVGDIYTRTEFNEGYGVEELPAPAGKRRGWGVNSRKVKKENLEQAIGVDVDTLLSGGSAGDKATALLEPRTKEDIEQSIITTLQVVGNCNTRSIRSLLRHVLGPKLLRGVYELATTPLPKIEMQLAVKFGKIQDGLSESAVKDLFYNPLQAPKTKPLAFEVSKKPGLSLTREAYEQLCEAIKVQVEHIFQTSFVDDDKYNFKKIENSLIDYFYFFKEDDHAKNWGFLNPKSYPKIAFMLAENFISNGVMHLNQGNPPKIEVSSKADGDEKLRKIMREGIFKVLIMKSIPEDEVGNDINLTSCAYDLIQRQKPRISAYFSSNSNVSAEFVAAAKSMFVNLTGPYVIDLDVCKIVEKELEEQMTAALNNYTLQDLLDKSDQIIKATQAKLDNNVTLKQSRKDNLPKSAVKAVPRKLKINKYKDIGGLFGKQIARINKVLDEGTQVTQQFLAEAVLFAIECCSEQLSDRLLKGNFQIDVNAKDSSGQTLLMKAAQVGDAKVIATLIAAGADTAIKDASGKNALMHAIELRNLDAIVKLIENSPRDVLKNQLDEKDKDGKDFLHLLVETDNPDLIKGALQALKKHPALLKSQLESNYSRATENHWDAKGNITKKEVVDDTLLQWAVRWNKVNVVKAVLESVADSHNLLSGLLLKARYKDAYSGTLLHKAASYGYKDMVTVILESIKDSTGLLHSVINEEDKSRHSPLSYAVYQNRQPEIALILLRYGAIPEINDLTESLITSDLRKDLCLKYVTSFAPSTGVYEGASAALPDFLKKMFPAIFPHRSDEHHRR